MIFWTIVAGIALIGLSNALLSPAGVADTPYKVHIALGFHVNPYHSFRADTNDENGFGQDIRIIQQTISELDRFNKKDKPMLARRIDRGWEAVAPLELRFSPRARTDAPFFIHKRNFLGKEAAYPVDYFRHSPKNLNVASINNHITAEYAGVTTSGSGMAVAMNTGVNANFAFCTWIQRKLL